MNNALLLLALRIPLAGTLITLLLCTALQSHADVSALLQPPQVRTVAISPDGGYLAMVRSDASKDTLVIIKRPEMAIAAGVSSAQGKRFFRLTWASSSQLLAETAIDRGPLLEPLPTGALISLRVDGARRTLLEETPLNRRLASAVVSVLPDDAQHVLAVATDECDPAACQGAQTTVWRPVKLNLESGTKTFVGPTPPVNGYYVSNPAGDKLMLAGRSSNGRVEVYQLSNGTWQAVSSFDPVSDLGTLPYAIDATGRVFALANKRGTAALYDWDTGSDEATEIFRDSASDIDNRVMSWGNRSLLAVRSDPGFPTWHYLDEADSFTALHKSLRAAFPDSDVDVTSMTRDGSDLIIRVHNDRNAGDFYAVNARTRNTELLAQTRPDLPAEALAAVEPITLLSRDDFSLRGYLATPSGKQGPHPMVMWVHDQPFTSRAQWRLDPELQLLVARGYAVLQINYRGSGGLGQWYTASGGERDGRAVQRDIADAARWAVEQEVASEAQICVLGRGYGGFAAVKSLADNVGVFKCAIGIDGFYDLSQPLDVPESPILSPQILLAVPTRLDTTDPSRAPLSRIDRIDGAVMLLGAEVQTTAMRDALDSASKVVVWRQGDNAADDYTAILAFLDNQLKGVAAAPGAVPKSFGVTLTTRQARQFQQIVAGIQQAAKEMAGTRKRSVSAAKREIRRIIDARDSEVRALVDDEQWALYPSFKTDLAQRIENDLEFVRLQ